MLSHDLIDLSKQLLVPGLRASIYICRHAQNMRAVPRAAAVETAKAKAPDSDIQAAERLQEMKEEKGP